MMRSHTSGRYGRKSDVLKSGSTPVIYAASRQGGNGTDDKYGADISGAD